jgi:hypothetical protein
MCNCIDTRPIPYNAQNITIGTYNGGPNKAVIVTFTTASGRVDTATCTTDSAGLIVVANPNLRMNTPYTVTVTDAEDAAQIEQGVLIGGTTYTCLNVEFIPEWKGDGTAVNPESFVISIP